MLLFPKEDVLIPHDVVSLLLLNVHVLLQLMLLFVFKNPYAASLALHDVKLLLPHDVVFFLLLDVRVTLRIKPLFKL